MSKTSIVSPPDLNFYCIFQCNFHHKLVTEKSNQTLDSFKALHSVEDTQIQAM